MIATIFRMCVQGIVYTVQSLHCTVHPRISEPLLSEFSVYLK